MAEAEATWRAPANANHRKAERAGRRTLLAPPLSSAPLRRRTPPVRRPSSLLPPGGCRASLPRARMRQRLLTHLTTGDGSSAAVARAAAKVGLVTCLIIRPEVFACWRDLLHVAPPSSIMRPVALLPWEWAPPPRRAAAVPVSATSFCRPSPRRDQPLVPEPAERAPSRPAASPSAARRSPDHPAAAHSGAVLQAIRGAHIPAPCPASILGYCSVR